MSLNRLFYFKIAGLKERRHHGLSVGASENRARAIGSNEDAGESTFRLLGLSRSSLFISLRILRLNSFTSLSEIISEKIRSSGGFRRLLFISFCKFRGRFLILGL
ncbi:hypothetical protein K1719_035517 [Acacia pycnantha]|nr:hypothetical protein K1719_035517 [Acacia pycnantha]